MPLTANEGYLTATTLRKTRRLLIGTEGAADSGKSEFALSAPGPGVMLCLDRGIDPVLDNQNPPVSRNPNFVFKVITTVLPTASDDAKFYKPYYEKFYKAYREVLDEASVRTVVIDGDSDSWELQQLAEFGRVTQVPQLQRTSVNAARRQMYARAWDSGKIIIATNKLRKEWQNLWKADGTPDIEEKTGKQKRGWDGKSYERQGFDDQEYLWQIQLRHLYNAEKNIWGIRILKAKADPTLVGYELWGDECNFKGLVQTVYPNIPMKEWGF